MHATKPLVTREVQDCNQSNSQYDSNSVKIDDHDVYVERLAPELAWTGNSDLTSTVETVIHLITSCVSRSEDFAKLNQCRPWTDIILTPNPARKPYTAVGEGHR